MAEKYLPDTDHIVRLIKRTLLIHDPDTDEVVGCFPGAFKLRPANENREAERHLSVSWLEFFPGTKSDRLQQVRAHSEMTIKPTHGLAILSVGDVHAACSTMNTKVRIIHEPTHGNPSHSSIHRYPTDHDELFALLANLASQDLTLSRDIPPISP